MQNDALRAYAHRLGAFLNCTSCRRENVAGCKDGGIRFISSELVADGEEAHDPDPLMVGIKGPSSLAGTPVLALKLPAE
jgi:hypothetical protein